MPTGKKTGSYVEYVVNSGLVGNEAETARFNMAMTFVMTNIEKPTHEMVYAAFQKAPLDIVEYFANDMWFTIPGNNPKDIPIYSVVAREILMERILLGGTERK